MDVDLQTPEQIREERDRMWAANLRLIRERDALVHDLGRLKEHETHLVNENGDLRATKFEMARQIAVMSPVVEAAVALEDAELTLGFTASGGPMGQGAAARQAAEGSHHEAMLHLLNAVDAYRKETA